MPGSVSVTRDTIADVEPLDNPIWHALTGAQAEFAQGSGLALRYEPDVGVFAAIPDAPSPDAWDALRTLIGPGKTAVMARVSVDPPPEWEHVGGGVGHQYLAPAELGDASPTITLTPLGIDDAVEMLALVERTQPGPFFKRTVGLGGYLGIRDDESDGALIAMAGERMRPRGYAEISAVCTDAAHRGRGLATTLVHAVARGIRARGDTPMLHVASDNTNAIALYERLGFTRRASLQVAVLRAPR